MMANVKRAPRAGDHQDQPEFFHPRVVARLLSALGQATLYAATNDDPAATSAAAGSSAGGGGVTGLSLALHETSPGEQLVAVGGEIVAWTRVTLETLRDQLRDREWTFCPCGEQHGQTETDNAVLAAVGADLLLLPAVSTPRP